MLWIMVFVQITYLYSTGSAPDILYGDTDYSTNSIKLYVGDKTQLQ